MGSRRAMWTKMATLSRPLLVHASSLGQGVQRRSGGAWGPPWRPWREA